MNELVKVFDGKPMSARRFWPAVRTIRPCDEYRRAYKRFVVFK